MAETKQPLNITINGSEENQKKKNIYLKIMFFV